MDKNWTILMSNSYPIQFETASFDALNQLLHAKSYSKVFVLADTNTYRACLPIVETALSDFDLCTIVIEAGEQHKNIQTCQYIWSSMMKEQADRQAVLLNLGGGVIGDMGGFCASTFKRGMDFIQIPTTLLAQVDASVGGKLGIDFLQVKNSIGLFCNPQAVFLHPTFFDTLPLAEVQSGYAEMIKHALIDTTEHWSQLSAITSLNKVDWQPLIEQSLQVKKEIVALDPFEKGIRKCLNFGHTLGHAIESLSWETERPLLHGQAVALGMLLECYCSTQLVGLSERTLREITAYILALYPKYDLTVFAPNAIYQLVLQDKKNDKNIINCTLLQSIGTPQINIPISFELIQDALDYYINLVHHT
jgi:3-dehydroquinate synthase